MILEPTGLSCLFSLSQIAPYPIMYPIRKGFDKLSRLNLLRQSLNQTP